MRKRRMMAILVSAAMLLGNLSPCAAAAAPEEEVLEEASEELSEETPDDREDTLLEPSEEIPEEEALDVSEEGADGNTANSIIARFDFDDLATPNAEINGEGAKATGTYGIVDDLTGGKALSININNGTFADKKECLKVTDASGDSLMTGLDAFTVSFELKQIRIGATNWPIFINKDDNSPSYGHEHYIGTCLLGDGALSVERYLNDNGGRDIRGTSATSIVPGEWYHIDIVEADGLASLYVNGQIRSKKTFDKADLKTSSIFGDNSVFYVGHATWGQEWLGGYMDNLTVYNYALSNREIVDEYNTYVSAIPMEGTVSSDSIDRGFVRDDFSLFPTLSGNAITEWQVIKESESDPDILRIEENGGVYTAVVTPDAEDCRVTLRAVTAQGSADYRIAVLGSGGSYVSYVSDSPIQGQEGGMKLARSDGGSYKAVHADQPVMYTAVGNKAYVSPAIFRKADGNGFGMITSDGGSNKLLLYDSEDLTTYENERDITLAGIGSVNCLEMVYDLTDERYELFVDSGLGKQYLFTSADLDSFENRGLYAHSFASAPGSPEDAVFASSIALRGPEYDRLTSKFTNPHATAIAGKDDLTKAITVDTAGDLSAELERLTGEESVDITYSNGESHTYGIHFNQSDVDRISSLGAGEYTLRAYLGGDSYVIDADDPLIPERADPYVTYDSDTGYYYFTASYPMYGSADADGYDRLVLRRARTVNGLADAEEVVIWDEKDDPQLGRFIWAPEIHKIGGKWYFIATAGLNTGTGTTFNIRPFMIRFNGESVEDEFLDPSKWGEAELVKAKEGDNILNGMSLDMTYFEAGGTHYLAWPDETKNDQNPGGVSDIFIATIDPSDPTQLTSNATLLTRPEYTWESVNIAVNEGPAVIKKDGKVYLAYSASATGSEYCVGYLTADETADLTDVSKWTKNPYPILTSGDFDNKLSGPGHNSFTVNAAGEPIIVFHARPNDAHEAHKNNYNDSLYDPCRSAYVRPVFFDSQGVPILNLSDTEFAGQEGSFYDITVTVERDNYTTDPILEYTFDEELSGTTVKDTASGNYAPYNGTLYGKPSYVEDPEYGQVLYLDGWKTNFKGNNSYLEFPQGLFDGRNALTISMDVKEVSRSGNYMTFAIGNDSNKYFFMNVKPQQLKAAITKSSSGGEKAAIWNGKFPNNSRDWINLKAVITKSTISLYRNGLLFAETENTGVSVSDLGSDLSAYLGRSVYGADQYFRGYFDNVRVYEYAMTEEQVAAAYALEEAERVERISSVATVADSFEIPHADDIRGNITLPDEINGVSLTWTSDKPGVINAEKTVQAGYDDIPAGVVTRGSSDETVELTAVFSKDSQASVTRHYTVTVKAAPTESDPYEAYLFAGFRDNQENAEKEQVYFATSRDGFNWVDLNENKPILYSDLGESGTRDQFIGRSAEGDRFYMIGTDLSIHNNPVKDGSNKDITWAASGSDGSNSIIIWESEDLINWSEPRMVEVAPWLSQNSKPGCTWAPEFYYDEKTGEYVVFFSCTHLEVDNNGNITQDYENHSVYYCKTRDFYSFTDAKLFISGGSYESGERKKRIDTTMIKDDATGKYYRYTKQERPGATDGGVIYIEQSDSILGEWTRVESPSLEDARNVYGELEGPSIFKLNDKDEDGNDRWCLLIDRFARGLGYQPFITTDLSSGVFTGLNDSEYSMPGVYRHGAAMPITWDEYKRLNGKWGDKNLEKTITIEKSSSGNPMLGFDENGNTIFGGDPSILVEGDTVYAYVGQDVSTGETYNMPDWKCYSSTDMKNWTYEGTILTCNKTNVTWAKDDISAWAGQVVKYGDKYYFYFCTETNASYGGGKSIGVAVSDTPTGPFTDIGHPLVRNIDTDNGVSTWEDIDPTVWIETDDKGVEHRVLGWGNTRFFNCELNEDMISVKDKDGAEALSAKKASEKADADIKVGVISGLGNHTFTEAPYYYRQQDDEGNYYGRYYMFFACDWREQMAYAYADSLEDFLNNEWTFGGVIMEPSATANTNHMAVFDFKGHTYFVYHDGSLPHGSGFRRVACVEEFSVNVDGSIDPIRKTATGLTGTLSSITDGDGCSVAVRPFENSLDDAFYPIKDKPIDVDYFNDGVEAGWEINPGKIYSSMPEYVSIESDYKPGLYISAGKPGTSYSTGEDSTIPALLAQAADGTADEAQTLTFRTLSGFAGSGVTFESVKYPGFYLVNRNGVLMLAKTVEDVEATFFVNERSKDADRVYVQKTRRVYTVGQSIGCDDIRVLVKKNGIYTAVTPDSTNAAGIDMSEPGYRLLEVTYTFEGVRYTKPLKIRIEDAAFGR